MLPSGEVAKRRNRMPNGSTQLTRKFWKSGRQLGSYSLRGPLHRGRISPEKSRFRKLPIVHLPKIRFSGIKIGRAHV
jgi:hypothetical protein